MFGDFFKTKSSQIISYLGFIVCVLCPGILAIYLFNRELIKVLTTSKLILLSTSLEIPLILLNTILLVVVLPDKDNETIKKKLKSLCLDCDEHGNCKEKCFEYDIIKNNEFLITFASALFSFLLTILLLVISYLFTLKFKTFVIIFLVIETFFVIVAYRIYKLDKIQQVQNANTEQNVL